MKKSALQVRLIHGHLLRYQRLHVHIRGTGRRHRGHLFPAIVSLTPVVSWHFKVATFST